MFCSGGKALHPHTHWESVNHVPCHLHKVKLHVTCMSTLLPVAVISNGKWSGLNAFFCVSGLCTLHKLFVTTILHPNLLRQTTSCVYGLIHLSTEERLERKWERKSREWREGVGVY